MLHLAELAVRTARLKGARGLPAIVLALARLVHDMAGGGRAADRP
jgi:hypothetical protein